MTCSKHQRIIDDIGDLDRLPPESARHVDACRTCSEFARNLVALRALLNEQGRVTAPSDFDARLARRIRDVRTPAAPAGVLEWFAVPQRMLAGAAAFALVAAGAFVVATYQAGSHVQDSGQVATNRSVPPREPLVEQPAVATIDPTPDLPGVTGTSHNNTLSHPVLSRPGNRRLQGVSRNTGQDEAMILVQDSAGARIVNVPRVLVGAERIVPVPESDASVASLDDRMAF